MIDSALDNAALDLAFEVSGAQATVVRPHAGKNRHQQYFTPRVIAESLEQLVRLTTNGKLCVLDPTAGSGRLLAPFKKAGDYVLGIELDTEIGVSAKRVLGNEHVRVGDIREYARFLSGFHVMVTNPPYALHWEKEGWGYQPELAGYDKIESQRAILELAHHALGYNGLLLGLFSGNFFAHDHQALAYLHKNFQVIAMLDLVKPFKQEYGLDVNATLVAAWNSYYVTRQGSFAEGAIAVENIVDAVMQGWRDTANTRGGVSSASFSYYGRSERVPYLNMVPETDQVDTGTIIHLKTRGVRPTNEWGSAWLTFYSDTLQDYSTAEGGMADIVTATASLPNLLLVGGEETSRKLQLLGFQAAITDKDRELIRIAGKRFAHDRTPLRPLKPAELLAHYQEGEYTVLRDLSLDLGGGELDADQRQTTLTLKRGQVVYLRPTWARKNHLAKVERIKVSEGKSKDAEATERTYVDRGFSVFNLTVQDAGPGGENITYVLDERTRAHVQFIIDALGLPQVKTVDDMPESQGWAAQMRRLSDDHQAAMPQAKQLFDRQYNDVVRLATRRRMALLYEQGGGKTPTSSFWAELRGFRRVLVIAPTSLAENWIGEWTAWGFQHRAARLSHNEISRIRAEKRAFKEAYQRRLTAQRRIPKLESRLAGLQARRGCGPAAIAVAHGEPIEHEFGATGISFSRTHQTRWAESACVVTGLEAVHLELQEARPSEEIPTASDEMITALVVLDERIASVQAALAREHQVLAEPLPAKPTKTRFWVASYEDISLDDPLYEPWSCEHWDRDGNLIKVVEGIRSKACPECGRDRVAPRCPQCRADEREGWTGRVCHKCGHVAYLQHKLPMYRRCSRLFGAVMLDESQAAKNKGTLRSKAVRAMQPKGRALLTGTIMSGFVTDLFWQVGWLLGFGSPLWPFPYQGGSRRFLRQFGTFTWVTREFEDHLSRGKARMIPSVSNLTRLWRLMSSFSIRRLKAEFIEGLPTKHRHVHWLKMSNAHAEIYQQVSGKAEEVFQEELVMKANKGLDPNMGRLSMALWWNRYAASCPNKYGAEHYAGAISDDARGDSLTPEDKVQIAIESGLVVEPFASFMKVAKTVQLVEEATTRGEKTIVFTSLRGLHRTIVEALRARGLRVATITTEVQGRKRTDLLKQWEADRHSPVLVAALTTINRGFTIVGANNVVILNTEWSPEATNQAEDRIHRPGQSRECHIHYLLADDSIDQGMWNLIQEKAEAQLAVLDRELIDKSVADLLEEAATASAQIEVARAILARPKVAVVTEELAEDVVAGESCIEHVDQPEQPLYGVVLLPRKVNGKYRPPRAIPGAMEVQIQGHAAFVSQADAQGCLSEAKTVIQLAFFGLG